MGYGLQIVYFFLKGTIANYTSYIIVWAFQPSTILINLGDLNIYPVRKNEHGNACSDFYWKSYIYEQVSLVLCRKKACSTSDWLLIECGLNFHNNMCYWSSSLQTLHKSIVLLSRFVCDKRNLGKLVIIFKSSSRKIPFDQPKSCKTHSPLSETDGIYTQ